MTRWKYDAVEHDPLTKLRIPVTSDHPVHPYTACFHRDSAQRPTDAEARQIASFIEEYQSRWFGENHWREVQRALPFDMDCPTTWIFHKWATGDWSYRRSTWRSGPHWAPVAPALRGTQYDPRSHPAPLTLVQVMDLIHSHGADRPWPGWLGWKYAHPGAFAV